MCLSTENSISPLANTKSKKINQKGRKGCWIKTNTEPKTAAWTMRERREAGAAHAQKNTHSIS